MEPKAPRSHTSTKMTTEQTDTTKCPICISPYTSSVRQKITCAFCPSAACRSCTQQFLLSSLSEPSCYTCKREWNREFLDLHFTMAFRKGPLKLHRRKVLVDREKSLLPSMQIYVEATVNRDKAWAELHQITSKYNEAHVEKIRLERLFNTSLTEEQFEQRMTTLLPAEARFAEYSLRTRIKRAMYDQHSAILEGRSTAKMAPRQFIMKCPGSSTTTAEPCRGFLSTQWKCGTCQLFYCHDCHALIGNSKELPHTCEAGAKATAALIQKETKPCPKCGIRISKIDGCDQMWCTSCQTAFSWNTGQIITHRIHNPHFYDWQRRNNNGAVPREVGDIPCGGIPDYYSISRNLTKYSRDIQTVPLDQRAHMLQVNHVNLVYYIHRSLMDLTDVRLAQYPFMRIANVNRDLDVQYLMGNVSQEKWAQLLEQGETKFERRREVGMVLQTLSHVGAEKMTEISNLLQIPGNSKRIIAILEELEHLRVFSNEALKKRGKQMGIVVPQIKENDWHWSMTRRTAPVQRTVDDGSTTISDDDNEVEVLPVTNAAAPNV